MELRRGFKAEAERLASELRAELGIGETAPVDPYLLAEQYGIPIVGLNRLEISPAAASFFRVGGGKKEFSAATVFAGSKRIIVTNPWHPAGRRANSITHELSHMILEHAPEKAVPGRARRWNAVLEGEADWLAATVLVPRVAAVEIVAEDMPISDAAIRYGVSEQLMKWRLNATGAYVQLSRRRAQ